MPSSKNPKPVYIVDGVRTPIGNPYKTFKSYTSVDLAVLVLNELVARNKIKKKDINEIILGHVISAGVGQNMARQAGALCGLPRNIVAFTINNVCGAGIQSVILGARSIKAHEAELVVVGGSESATHSPYLISRKDLGSDKEISMIDSIFSDGLYCRIVDKSMGEIVENMVKKHKISREEQDQYTFESHKKAYRARTEGSFDDEMIMVMKGKKQVFDDRPRRNISMESLRDLPPAFKSNGVVTAGNSSVPCDGAAALLLASEKYVKSQKLKPRARIVGYHSIMGDPELTFESSVAAVNACLKDCRLEIKDIDLFEVAEAFSAQMIYLKKKLKIPEEKLNIFGGDIAFGHPLGAAGARSLVTLVHALKKKKLKRGCVAISYGGGGAIAMVVEAI